MLSDSQNLGSSTSDARYTTDDIMVSTNAYSVTRWLKLSNVEPGYIVWVTPGMTERGEPVSVRQCGP